MPAVTKYTEALVESVLERLAKGEPLAVICRDDGMPTPNGWRNWCATNEDLAIAYARAREDGFDQIAMDALAIADESGSDTKYGRDGQEAPDSEWISRSKLRVETRLKLLAKWDPKRYGDRTLVGSDPENPLPTGVVVTFKG